MGEVYTYNATHLTIVREGSVEITQCAENGGIGTGRFAIDDTDGTQAIVGHKNFSHTESACSFPLSFRGFVADRTYGRDAGTDRKPHVGAARGIGVQVQDLNAMLGFRLVDDEDGNRPAETVAARMTWLMASDYVSGLFTGTRVTTVTSDMDESDYRHQFPGDVIADCALAADGFNYHVNDWGSGPDLTFRNDNTSTADTSTLRISNVLSDASGVTLNPFKDATLTRRPGRVISKIAYSYAKGTVIRERAATATTFNGERGGSASNSNIKTSSMATRAANNRLSQLRLEEDIIECTVLATSAQVNLILPGHRIQAKFSHLNTEGYGSFIWFRVLERTWQPIVADGGLYEIRLKLSPQEAADDAPLCDFDETAAATYYPLGTSNDPDESWPNLVGTSIAYYQRGGIADPFQPTPTYQGRWHFPTFGVGGSGTTDYFASGFGNSLQFVLVGNGTLTIQTEQWEGQSQPFTIVVRHHFAAGNSEEVATDEGIAGEAIVVPITEADDPDCINIVQLRADERLDGSYIGMGWSAAAWVV